MSTISLDLAKNIHEVAEEKGISLPNSAYIGMRTSNEMEIEMAWRDTTHSIGADIMLTVQKYTTDELLEMLPAFIGLSPKSNEKYHALSMEKTMDGGYTVSYKCLGVCLIGTHIFHSRLVDALGNLLLWLLENDYGNLLTNQ